MHVLAMLKKLPPLILASLFFGGILVIVLQNIQLQKIKTNNMILLKDFNKASSQLSFISSQKTLLFEALEDQRLQSKKLEEINETVRQRLYAAQKNDTCAGMPVPADVIRVQQENLIRSQ
ncbi:hypothetical protein [Klebsiella pneumoniae]|uniref:hypothetical protein n=1 Tax=Klebsiella pneumoniae TaxID=573 RepID=UPI003B430EAC